MQLELKLRAGAKFHTLLGVTACVVPLPCGGT